MQHQKALLFRDNVAANKVIHEEDPYVCRTLGRYVAYYKEEIWAKNCISIMRDLVESKFVKNDSLKKILTDTGAKQIGAGGEHEKFWGIGLSIHDTAAADMANWKGKNNLGKVFMQVRANIK